MRSLLPVIDWTTEIQQLLRERILVIDGAMSTMIQRHNLKEADPTPCQKPSSAKQQRCEIFAALLFPQSKVRTFDLALAQS